MNKNIFILPMIMLLSICLVSAYNTTYLKHYYSFETLDESYILDSVTGTNLTYNIFGADFVKTDYRIGKVGLGLFSNSTMIWSGATFNNFTGVYTINMWFRRDVVGNSGYYYYFRQTNTSNISDTFFSAELFSNSFSNISFSQTREITGGTKNNFQSTLQPYYTFSMITIVRYNDAISGLPRIEYYLDGIRQNSNSLVNSTLMNNSYTSLTIGGGLFGMIDELSVWNTNLQPIDIVTLYNNAVGLSYADTLSNGNITSLNPRCLDSSTYCSDVGVNAYGTYYCNSVLATIFCSAGCINDLCYTSGIAECGTLGETRCADTTNYNTCDDSNGDGFLDFKQVTSCPLNTYCVDYYKQAQCKNVSQSGVHEQYALGVTPYGISNENTTYNINQATKTVGVNTIYTLHTQKFYDSGVNFTTRTCNYNETLIYTQTLDTINVSKSYTLTTATNQNSILRISILPNNYANGSIETFSQGSTSNGKLYYIRNSTAKNICIQNSSRNDIYCDYDYTGTDTLKSVQLEYTFDFTTKYYTLKMFFERTYSNTRIAFPKVFFGNDLYRIVIDSNDTILNNISVNTVPLFNSFSNVGTSTPLTTINPNCICGTGTLTCAEYKLLYGNDAYVQLCSVNSLNQIFTNDCLYTTNGVRTVRTYGNNNGIPDYSVYYDYNVNILKTGLTQQQLSKETKGNQVLFGSDLLPSTKYLIVLFTILLIIGTFTGIGFTMNMVQSTFVIGVIISVFAMIMFTVIGWIPVWILLTLILVCVAVSILVSKTPQNATG